MLQQALPRTHAEVSWPVFMGVLWTLVGLSLILLLSRLAIRLKSFKRLFWDDGCVILSWLMFLTTAILYRINMPRVYRNYEALQGIIPYDEHAIQNWDYFMHLIVPFNVLFYSSLWAVKLSFLLFFARLGNKLWHFEVWWWVVLVITTAGYVACIADIQYECSRPARSFEYIIENCNTIEKTTWVMKTLYANAGLDVGTDIMSKFLWQAFKKCADERVLSIPFLILWNTGVALRKKIILFSIFSATIAIMIVALIRVTVVNAKNTTAEICWLYFWSSVENGTAVMIACVASFRQLFVAARDHSERTNSSSNMRFLRFGRNAGRTSDSSKSAFKWPFLQGKQGPAPGNRTPSEDHILPLEFVTVQKLESSDM